MERAYATSGEEVLNFFHVDEQRGLSEKEVTDAQIKYGKNCKELLLQRKGVVVVFVMLLVVAVALILVPSCQPYQKNLLRRYGSSCSNSLKISSS